MYLLSHETGPNWPSGGEIDIVEGVNDYTNNQATIHTDPGCTIPTSNSNQLAITGTLVGGTNCAAAQTGNQGCGVRASESNSFGAAFNKNGGGVYASTSHLLLLTPSSQKLTIMNLRAVEWDNSGISIFFFPRNSIPNDIAANAPQPDSWGKPMAFWPSSGCDPFKFFKDHSVIFDTTLCGDWASSAWTGSGIPGQEQSCAQRTGVSTCEEFIRNNGASMNEACTSSSMADGYFPNSLTYVHSTRLGGQVREDLPDFITSLSGLFVSVTSHSASTSHHQLFTSSIDTPTHTRTLLISTLGCFIFILHYMDSSRTHAHTHALHEHGHDLL